MTVKFARFLTEVLVLLMVVGLAGAAQAGEPVGQPAHFLVQLGIGQKQALVNGESKTLDVPPMLYEGRTMVPLRFIAEALGADVWWNPAEQGITIVLAAKDSITPLGAEIKIAMQEAAQQAKIKLADADPVVVIGKESQLTEPGVRVVNAAIQGVDALNIEQLAKGADVLFTFMQLPTGSELPSGFYVIHVKGDPKTNKWVAQFKNMDGRVVLEKPAELGKGASASGGKVKVTVKISFPGPKVTLDIHWSSASFQTAFGLGNGDPDTTPLAAEKSAAQDSKKALDAFIPATTKALTQAAGKYGKGILDGWMSLSRGDDLLVAYTVFKGVNDLTSEELAKGQDVFFGFFRTPEGSKLIPGFYKVRIVQESGRWLGYFVNDKGEVVYKGPAEVTEGEYTAKPKPKGEFTGDVGPDSAMADYHWTDRKGREHTIEITIHW